MESNIFAIVTAVLAGGFLNQLFNTLFGDKITQKRDFAKWRRTERYTTYFQLLDLISSRTPDCGVEKWPGKVRALCQKIYLLHDKGRPPQALCDSMEEVFQLTNRAKKKEISDEDLGNELRTIGSKLRRQLASSLENG